MIINSYTSKSNAARGLSRMNVNAAEYVIERNDAGKFIIVHVPPVVVETTPIVAKPYKLIYSRAYSRVDAPFHVVHSFLNDKGASLTRKQAVNELVAMGVNYSTARTQYQRWFTKNKA